MGSNCGQIDAGQTIITAPGSLLLTHGQTGSHTSSNIRTELASATGAGVAGEKDKGKEGGKHFRGRKEKRTG